MSRSKRTDQPRGRLHPGHWALCVGGVAIALATGCKGFGTREQQGAVPITSTPSWEYPIADLFDVYCNDCHSARPRNSAPNYLRTDIYDDAGTVAGVVSLFDRHLARAADSARPMPPPPDAGLTAAELDMLQTWADLGYPRTIADAETAVPRCPVGDVTPCACAGGFYGWQECLADGTLSTCECSAPRPDAGGTDAGGTDAGGTDAGGTDSGGTDSGPTDTGGTDTGTDAGSDTVTSAALLDDVYDIVAPSCGTRGCHAAGGTPPDLATRSGLAERLAGTSVTGRGMPYVTPADPSQSYLYLKCLPDFRSRGVGSGTAMPPTAGLPTASSDIIASWINGGALP